MEILQQLGLNDSYFFQFLIFAFAYLVLSQVLFKPYADALEQRDNRTKGGEEIANETTKATEDIRNSYESKAKQVSAEIKNIFDEQKSLANKEYESIVSSARAHSVKMIEDARAKVATELVSAKKQIQETLPSVVSEMSKKLLSK